jgi:hypothetical protein
LSFRRDAMRLGPVEIVLVLVLVLIIVVRAFARGR